MRSGFNVKRVMLTSLGSFHEAEIRIEAPSSIMLIDAYNYALKLAKEVLHDVHDVIRALVILIPSDDLKTFNVSTSSGYNTLVMRKSKIISSLINNYLKVKKNKRSDYVN